jgi:hypothetical protein
MKNDVGINFRFNFIRSYHSVHKLFAGSSGALDQNLHSRPGLVNNSLDPAGRGVESTGSASGQLVGVRVGHRADAICEVVTGTIGVV